MKIAIIYNRESKAVINLFGVPNKEKYGLNTIEKVREALIEQGHQVRTFEGDKNIIKNLEEFMPAVISGERPGLVFNLSYGIQGKGRYMHIPGILEMLGIPYVGSSPETHAVALDKIITKMILLQKGIPTPRFSVLETPNDELKEDLTFPLIVKPKSEAVSFGIKIVNNTKELKEGVEAIYKEFNTSTLVEEYIDGREFNVGLLGNENVETLEPVELLFDEGEKIFTYEDKMNTSGRTIVRKCPPDISNELSDSLKELAIRTFNALGCYDSARVDFRVDSKGRAYVLEVNSMASLSPTASYVFAAEKYGLKYNQLIQKLIEVASIRYFGTYTDLNKSLEKNSLLFNDIIQNRNNIESELKNWTNISTATDDPVSINNLVRKIDYNFKKINMKKDDMLSNNRYNWFWKSEKGFEGGTVFVIPIDIPGIRANYSNRFKKESELLLGEGIASSRAGLVSVLNALKSINRIDELKNKKIGVFVYADEGYGMSYSKKDIKNISKNAKNVLVMHPSYNNNMIVNQRRGMAKLKVVVEGSAIRVGSKSEDSNALQFTINKFSEINKLSEGKKYLSISIQDIKTNRYSILVPHKITLNIIITYINSFEARNVEMELRKIFKSNNKKINTYIEKIEDRAPLNKNKNNNDLANKFIEIAKRSNIELGIESALLPSAAGEIIKSSNVICGLSPGSKSLYTPNESINRRELIEKTLLITEFLMEE